MTTTVISLLFTIKSWKLLHKILANSTSSFFTSFLPASHSLSLTSDATFFEEKIEKYLPELYSYPESCTTYSGFCFLIYIFFQNIFFLINKTCKSCNSTDSQFEEIPSTMLHISPLISPYLPPSLNSKWHNQPQDSYESRNPLHTMAKICFLPGEMVISNNMKKINICLIQPIHWCPTRLNALSPSDHPLYLMSLWDHIHENMGFIHPLCMLVFLSSLRRLCYCSDFCVLQAGHHKSVWWSTDPIKTEQLVIPEDVS